MKLVTLYGEGVFNGFSILGYIDETISEVEVIHKINAKYDINLVYNARYSFRGYDVYNDANDRKVNCIIEWLYKFE